MIARAAYLVVVAGLAVLTVFAQLDRAARFDPALARSVPPAFAGFAAEQQARAAIRSGDADAALAASRRLLLRRPIPAEHLALLSFAEAMGGDTQRAATALQAASLRGWREPLSQRAGAEAALIEGQPAIAAQRITALFATGQLPEQSEALAARLLQDAEGRAALARRLAAHGRWQANALPAIARSAAPRDVADTLARAEALNAELPCPALERAARSTGIAAIVPPRCEA